MRSIVVFAALMLAACNGTWTVSDRAFVLCSGYVSALQQLATFRAAGQLSESAVRRVDSIRAELNPVCSSAVHTHGALDAVEAGVRDLLQIRRGADL